MAGSSAWLNDFAAAIAAFKIIDRFKQRIVICLMAQLYSYITHKVWEPVGGARQDFRDTEDKRADDNSAMHLSEAVKSQQSLKRLLLPSNLCAMAARASTSSGLKIGRHGADISLCVPSDSLSFGNKAVVC
ncbi:hypothetical protein PoB_004837500 [Plakobranchus ocellatus]|uniref:Uncharacterized protein n=1 Tax=Plakobranchus ocellatus TaxID=259542 RepID=A0AAV4BS02_9GAST|nr:hypothetical protein PoB_004837500 [Plakobranchus ocellatus]